MAEMSSVMSDLNQLSVKYLYSVGECLPYLLNLSQHDYIGFIDGC